jgi:hypothetical protein
MHLHTISKYFFWALLFFLSMGKVYGKNESFTEYHDYKTEHGIEFQFTDDARFVNVLHDGKLIWRQYLSINGARLRAHEERRFYFEDIDRNGTLDFYYVFENYIGTAEQMRPDSFWTRPAEKQERDSDFDPFKDTKADDFAFFICMDMGENCALIRYQAEGKCIDKSGFNFQLCAKYRGKDKREKASVEISSNWDLNQWEKMLGSFGNKYFAPEIMQGFRYAVSNGNVSIIEVPEIYKPLIPWASRVRVKSERAFFYQGIYSNKQLGRYLVAGDEVDVLDRYIGSVLTDSGSELDVIHRVELAKLNRILVRYKGKRSTSIGWIDMADTLRVGQ